LRYPPLREKPLAPMPDTGSSRGLPPRMVLRFNVAMDMGSVSVCVCGVCILY
jgi:hypothetical protein